MIVVTDDIVIHEQEIKEVFVRSSGPGGQNVNKVSTAVQLRFDAAHSTSLPDDVRRRLSTLAGKRMTSDGILVIDARSFRTQERNRRDALDRMVTLIRQAARRPKTRQKTRPTAAARERRLERKRLHSATKRRRSAVKHGEE